MAFTIGNARIGQDEKPYFIADIAANHDGDLNRAFRLIELAKEAGADAAKFQNFRADSIVSRNGFAGLGAQMSHQKEWKKSVYEVYEDASLPDEWTPRLKEKCDEAGIEYMTSPYDYASVDLADRYSRCFKIGSGDITWTGILEYIAKKGKPVMLATGASGMEDVRRAMSVITKYCDRIALMQCNTNYTAEPANFKYINLNVLRAFRSAYPNAVLGLSDHTHGHETVLGAITLGACVIEKHFTDDNSRAGPDHKFSMTPTSWKEMVAAANRLYEALGDGVKRVEENEKETTIVQRRGLYYTRSMTAGTELREAGVFPLRPALASGVPAYEMEALAGRVLERDVTEGDAVSGRISRDSREKGVPEGGGAGRP